MDLAFPVLQVSDDSITTFRDEAALRQTVSLTTDKAIRAGLFERARLFDANLVEHKVERLELAGKSRLFGWMTRTREIKALEVASKGRVELVEVKTLVATAIRNSALWAENEDLGAVLGEIETATTFSALAALFG